MTFKPGLKREAAKKPKYHFEGQSVDEKGKKVYLVTEIKTGKSHQWDEAEFKKKESQVEY